MPKVGTKNALYGYFWAIVLKNYYHIWNQYPWICLIGKFCGKTEKPKFGTKNALFGYFWARNLNNYVIFEFSTLEFVKNESLTYAVNFTIESAFSKSPGSAFSEGPGPVRFVKYVSRNY